MKINPLTDRHYNKQEGTGLWDENLCGTEHSDIDSLSTYYPHPDEPRSFEVPGGSTPSQYALPDGATELQDLIEAKGMNFAMGNILKAAYRYGTCRHSDRRRDLNKIIWFANRELKRLDNEL